MLTWAKRALVASVLAVGGSLIAIGVWAQVANPPGYPYGTTPPFGYGALDGNFIHGIIRGVNWTAQYSLAAAGSGQSSATQIPSYKRLVEFDSGSGGFSLPWCYTGVDILVYNNSGSTLTAYPAVQNNPVTSAQDTINGSATLGSISNHTAVLFFCVKAGNWAEK